MQSNLKHHCRGLSSTCPGETLCTDARQTTWPYVNISHEHVPLFRLTINLNNQTFFNALVYLSTVSTFVTSPIQYFSRCRTRYLFLRRAYRSVTQVAAPLAFVHRKYRHKRNRLHVLYLPYPTPCLQRREFASLSDYNSYVQNFLTRARCARHALQKHYVERMIFWKSVIK